ncbi:50S ribosomal protein L34e [Infirmifilum lucidum]|uniref:Large ribosomal subunit protein eL34 n=1 Tax=Infirmifilum lucidum TaxID=2776706 RepID=A0A7L9FKR0_9CREN|nr:50S ribosomal protein L34e [Infirmifilum lucidum]QOJ79613.1 50S ribosomal protein L34e [Infirmifilum lucidum]
MVRPALRSRTKKRKTVRTPGGRHVLRILDKKHDYPKCAVCGAPIQGVPKLTIKEERKGVKVPTRPYGGYLCHRCLKQGIKLAARTSAGA